KFAVNSIDIAVFNYKSICAVLYYLFNALPSAGDDGFSRGHRFQVNTSQTFIMTGQCEYDAAAHGISNLGPSLASEKTYLLCRSELRAQHGEPRTFRTIANNFATQSRMALLNRIESSQQQFVTLTGDKVADAE